MENVHISMDLQHIVWKYNTYAMVLTPISISFSIICKNETLFAHMDLGLAGNISMWLIAINASIQPQWSTLFYRSIVCIATLH